MHENLEALNSRLLLEDLEVITVRIVRQQITFFLF